MIPCSECPQSYIGETGRPFKIRLKEHQDNVRRREEGKSAVAKHAWQTGHPPLWPEAALVHKASDWHSRIIVESVVISMTSNYNRKDGIKVIDRATRKQILDALPKLKKKICPNG